MRQFHFDYETRSAAGLPAVGSWRYSVDPSTSIICMAYAVDDSEPILLLGDEILKAIWWAWSTPDVVMVAHNVFFEISITINQLLRGKLDILSKEFITKWYCSAAQCRAAGIASSLEHAAKTLGLAEQKDLAGKKAMMTLSKPKRQTKKDTGMSFWTYEEKPELFKQLYSYCKQDVRTEREICKATPRMAADEMQVFYHDLLMNLRGVQTDPDLCYKALKIGDEYTLAQNIRLQALTGLQDMRVTKGKALMDWLNSEQGTSLKTLNKDVLKVEMPKMSLSQVAAEALAIRTDTAKSSTAKYQAILDWKDPADDRLRGYQQHYGAIHTGRFNGGGVQLLNLPRGSGYETDQVADVMKHGDLQLMEFVYPKPMHALSAAIRRAIIASPGHELFVGDYSAIENRLLLWMAGHEDGLDMYRALDRKTPGAVDLYVDMARHVYGDRAIEKKTHPIQRGIGKEIILACGYQMGRNKFFARCQANNVNVSLEFAGVCVNAFRTRWYKVPKLWYRAERMVKECFHSHQPMRVECESGGPSVLFTMEDSWLVMTLPSGRRVMYHKPFLDEGQVAYYRFDSKGQWVKKILYGGLIVENIIQSIGRDVAVFGMQNCEKKGYKMLFLPHDECVTERVAGTGSVEEFQWLMNLRPEWACTCPLVSEVWKGDRYKK
jgi:DNA polymerase